MGTAAWKIKSVKVSDDRLVNVAWIDVVCRFPAVFEKLNTAFKLLLSKATIDGKAEPLFSVQKKGGIITLKNHLHKRTSKYAQILPGIDGLAAKPSNKSITGASFAGVACAR